jgi:transposase-like protein
MRAAGAKYLTPDQIKEKLKLADELRAAGKPIHEVSRILGITDSTLYNWRKRYLGGRDDKDAQIAALRDENRRLRRMVKSLVSLSDRRVRATGTSDPRL